MTTIRKIMLKRILFGLFGLLLLALISVYIVLWSSLPALDGRYTAPVSSPTTLSRDARGHVTINADNRFDAAYAAGFAHAQDRLFQMDLLRRAGAGEISALFGKAALKMDERARFHQFRKRAEGIYASLPSEHKALLDQYAQGVNAALSEYSVLPFEYLLLQTDFAPWKPEDSLLVSFSMYMDLQHAQVLRDLTFTRLQHHYGQEMVDFLLLPSAYQAALDGSWIPRPDFVDVPLLAPNDDPNWAMVDIPEPIDIGSNNWAVGSALTATESGMMSDDMHLGLNVPPIWYRMSMYYKHKGEDVTLHGVSLPGSPGIIVGTNTHVAWGFTNANLDNTDWIVLAEETPTWQEVETITANGEAHEYTIEMSDFGPVKTVDGQRYALRWVAHMPYAINLNHADLDTAKNLEHANKITKTMGIPVQNFVAVDRLGNVGWMPAGAVTARPTPSNTAISIDQYSERWQQQANDLPAVINPDDHRIWTANARVISAEQMTRFGDGGYSVGARGLQIRDRLYEKSQFAEPDFYAIQLDNKAQFMSRWHALLVDALRQSPQEFEQDLKWLNDWQACSCSSSVGYTLVRKFRSSVINALFAPLQTTLEQEDLSLSPVLRHVEPATIEILSQQTIEWLPSESENYDDFLRDRYRATRQQLIDSYAEGDETALSSLTWGHVNELNVQHPFSRVMPILAPLLDMKSVPGFGDSYLPAVQNGTHGASQRLTVQPGYEQNAILTIPGGQSGHPLSQFYRRGFDDYVDAENTPLLPGNAEYSISFQPLN